MRSKARLGVGLALAALAAPAPAQAVGDVDFSLVPVGAGRYFVFDARSDETIVGRLGVVSRADRTQTIVLRSVDVGTAATGGLDYGLGSPARVGTWLTLARRRLTLGPGDVVNVPFKAHIPDSVSPGDHLGGLVAYESAKRRGRTARARGLRLAFRSRLAVAVQLRVPGPRHPRVVFRGATIQASPSGVRIYLRLRNSGNTLIGRTRGRVVVSQAGHDGLDIPVDIDTFAPDSEIGYPLALPGTPVQATYHLAGVLHPARGPGVRIDTDVELTGRQATAFERATGRSVERPAGSSPLTFIALMLPLLIAAVFAVAYRNARR
ncbi:MAG TPA: hypothetical protein VK486_04250 [Thermoleophilaceae bacterium]|nr:hypothetical protein [Thermoleophilaceae bacterium]